MAQHFHSLTKAIGRMNIARIVYQYDNLYAVIWRDENGEQHGISELARDEAVQLYHAKCNELAKNASEKERGA